MLTCKNCIHGTICLSYAGFEYTYFDEEDISSVLTNGDVRKLCLDFALDWVSPDVELPKDGEQVLIKDADGNVGIAQFRQYQMTPISPTLDRWLGCNSTPKLWKPIS